MTGATDHIIAFRAALEANGIVFKGDVIADGTIHRVHIEGDRNGSRNGWYKLHLDGRPAGAFGNWKEGSERRLTWVADRGTTRMTPDERAELKAKIEADKRARADAEAELWARAAERANALWDASPLAPDDHPYLRSKGIRAHGMRVGTWVIESPPDPETGEIRETKIKNALLVPVKDAKDIVSLQAIFPSAKNPLKRGKDYLKDGRKAGCFMVLGKPTEVSGQRTFVLCEGFSTGASIHEATGLCVVVCFDVGNLDAVARRFRDKYCDDRLVIACDNDRWTKKPVDNPGVTAGRKAAFNSRGIVAIPEFRDEDLELKPTDFNDLAQLQGPAAVKQSIMDAISPPVRTEAVPAAEIALPVSAASSDVDDEPVNSDGYFRILGADHDTFFVYQFEMRQVLEIPASSVGNQTALLRLAPLAWWETNFHGDKGLNLKLASNWFIRTAQRRHGYNPKMLRGRGAWADDGRIVYHFGDKLLVDGRLVDLAHLPTDFLYERAEPLPRPGDTALTAEEGNRLLDLISMYRWTRPASAPLLLGWVALAPICGILKWRPHIWLTGGAGSGKSTIQELSDRLLNGMSLYAQGNSTEAGVRQELKSDAIPVLFDESEKNNERERGRMDAVIALIRQSSSRSRAKTLRGTAGGSSMSWHVRSMFYLASIQVGLTHQADRDRFTVLELRGRRAEIDHEIDPTWKEIQAKMYEIERDEGFPARFARRIFDKLPVTLKNVDVFIDVAAKEFGSQREGDQYGTLMAGAWSMIHDGVATEAQARGMIRGYAWEDYVDSSEVEDDSNLALSVLMSAHIRAPNGLEVTVDELICRAAGYQVDSMASTPTRADCQNTLKRYGMRVEGAEVWFSNNSRELTKLVGDSPYATDLRRQLLRTKGARVGVPKKFNGTLSRYVSLPVSAIADPAMIQVDLLSTEAPF